MSSERPSADPGPDYREADPVYLHARREAVVLLVAFVVCLVWSVGCSYWLGFSLPMGDEVPKVWGMPRWVFWGVLIPWLAADVFTIWFCCWGMANDSLEPESGEEH